VAYHILGKKNLEKNSINIGDGGVLWKESTEIYDHFIDGDYGYNLNRSL
jgi:hypothetical protein